MSRRFDKKTYTLAVATHNKIRANQTARGIAKQGGKYRIVKTGEGYGVYSMKENDVIEKKEE